MQRIAYVLTIQGCLLAGAAAAVEVAPEGHDEIIVTAQRRSQESRSVPAALTALGSGEIERRGIYSAEDLPMQAPGLLFARVFEMAKEYQSSFRRTPPATPHRFRCHPRRRRSPSRH